MRRVDNSCSAGQRRDSGHLVVRERDVEDLQVFAQLFDVQDAGDGDDPFLLDEPPQRDLRDAQLPPPGDLLQDRIVQDRPAGERRMGVHEPKPS